MGKFQYRYDTIIRVKEIQEKRIQEEIALIEKEIKDLKYQISVHSEERLKVQRSMVERPLKAAEFHSAKLYDSILERQINIILKKIELNQLKKEEKNSELIERRKEQKVFETLRENKLNEFIIEETRNEMKEINEIAIRKYSEN